MTVLAEARALQLVHGRADVRAAVGAARAAGETVALVPTMGFLHDGHMSLVHRARELADRVMMSIFVNPLQFGPSEDLDRYPRDLEGDLRLAREHGVDLVFAPSAAEMYPHGPQQVRVEPGPLGARMEGAIRPGHFSGMLTVVAKLFGIFGPDVAVFGQKDFQQATLIRRMVGDLDLPVRVEVAPIVREADGLAMSSRNVYLSAEERARALALHRGLRRGHELFAAGERDAAVLRQALWAALRVPGIEPEYAEAVHPDTLEPVAAAAPGTVLLVAARVGGTRLIDNAVLS
ncbi:MAG TPA: pantoate--beta-alanine ligase [Longimicrobium sp.]|jgi:pantoate--beta-alanine ligase|uniref:pantoate--beta-alanine ligase n=1 Tax=Longimicrobium sp. TaxID=2029185 RepID=UPI002ED8BCCC